MFSFEEKNVFHVMFSPEKAFESIFSKRVQNKGFTYIFKPYFEGIETIAHCTSLYLPTTVKEGNINSSDHI